MSNESAPEISFLLSEDMGESALVRASIRAKNTSMKTAVFKVEFLRVGAFGTSDSYFRANNLSNTKLFPVEKQH